jgi:diguanylate cyclase (GGDEF)-like protein
MKLRREPYGKPHLWYMVCLGALSLALVVATTADAGWPFGPGTSVSAASFATFLVFCLAARFLAIESLQGMAISLDSAFYIAAIWTLGPLAAAWVAMVVFFIDKVRRTLRRELALHSPRTLWGSVAEVLYSVSSVGAQFLLVGWIVPLETLRASAEAAPGSAAWWALGTIPFLTLLLVAMNYGLAGVSLWLQGREAAEVRGSLFRHGILAECLQIPLSMAVVQVYDPQDPFNLVLLGTTFLLINAVFRGLTRARDSLHRRVSELTTLNELGRAMASTLQLEELLSTTARSTLRDMERASALTVGLWAQKDGGYRFRVWARGAESPEDRMVPRGEGVDGWVLQNKATLLVEDLWEEGQIFSALPQDRDSQVRSWLGVPLVVYDESIGVLSVQSAEPRAFGEDDRRLLEAIGQQAAVAIENARLYELATVDGLTGLYVRRYFDQRLEEEWMRSARYHTAFAVVLFDLDDFKCVNDRFGHQAGDRLLRESAQVLRRKMRAVDIPARYGGEEFALLLPRTSSADAAIVANRIRTDLAEHRLSVDGREIGVTASIGVAAYPECGDVDAIEVLHRADLALYQAKESGKNRVCVYRPEERSRVQAV